MPTRFTTASQPAVSFARVSGSCTSTSTSWRTRCRPTKPLPPMTRMRLMLLTGESASVTSKRAGQVRRTPSMAPPQALLNDGLVLNRRHALGGAARQDRAQARLQGRGVGPEDGGVVNRVRHHLLDVLARLAERNGLDEDRALDRSRAAP